MAEDTLFGPLAIDELHFRRLETGSAPEVPPAPGDRFQSLSFASTEFCPWRKRLLTGEVDDENAWCLNGVGGHAGLFGTASGVYALLSFMWDIHSGKMNRSLWPREHLSAFSGPERDCRKTAPGAWATIRRARSIRARGLIFPVTP